MEKLDATIESERKELGKKPFEHKDGVDLHTMQIQQSKRDPESGQLHKEGKPDGYHLQRASHHGQQKQHHCQCVHHSG